MLPENTTGSYEHGRKWLGVIPDIKKVLFLFLLYLNSLLYIIMLAKKFTVRVYK